MDWVEAALVVLLFAPIVGVRVRPVSCFKVQLIIIKVFKVIFLMLEAFVKRGERQLREDSVVDLITQQSIQHHPFLEVILLALVLAALE